MNDDCALNMFHGSRIRYMVRLVNIHVKYFGYVEYLN